MKRQFHAKIKVTTKSGLDKQTVDQIMEGVKETIKAYGDITILGFTPFNSWTKDGGYYAGEHVAVLGEIETTEQPILTASKVAFELSKGHWVDKVKSTAVTIS